MRLPFKSCYCATCDRAFDPLGIAGHRAMHRRRAEDCEIRYSRGDTYLHEFSRRRTEDRDE